MSIDRRKLTENELHDYVAELEGHGSQVTGVVGYFYAQYRNEVIARLEGVPNHAILEVGCGEGMMFDGTDIAPIQMDVSMRRVRYAKAKGQAVLCGDGYHLPFADASFSIVLLIAMLEHTSQPWRVLAEARRVLKPGGRAIMLVPNDFTMSAGRLVLGKFPLRVPRSPDSHHSGTHAPMALPRVTGLRKAFPSRFAACRLR